MHKGNMARIDITPKKVSGKGEMYQWVVICDEQEKGSGWSETSEQAFKDAVEYYKEQQNNEDGDITGFNQKRIDKFITVTDDWHSCYDGNKIKVSLFLTYMPEMEFNFVRIMAWGQHEFGLTLDYENDNYNALLEKYEEVKNELYNIIPDGIDKEWFYERGFKPF
jgi:hypothetical protein